MKRLIILGIILFLGTTGIYGMMNLSGDGNFFAPSSVAAFAEQTLMLEDIIFEQTQLEPEIEKAAITFSHTDNFYDSDIFVELFSDNPDAAILYTLDGSNPDVKSKASQFYESAIVIKAGSKVKATTIKAIAIFNDSISETVTKSYVTGKGVFRRFDSSTFVFVLSTDPYNLYDYNYGIAVEGYLREEYINSDDYHGGNIDPPAPANYNMRGIESERDVYVEVYDNTGKKVIEQAAGVRVSGGWSRGSDQKSLKLFARNSYSDGNGMFKHSFFPDSLNSLGQLITKYDRIILRNGGNDRESANMRDELSQELARQSGFLDTQDAVPTAVFLNGEYYGFAWLKEAFCNGYLEQTYGGLKENYQIVQNTEDGSEGEQFALDDYQYMIGLARTAVESDEEESSFNNNEVFDEFCNLVDLDNLILYYAIQTYIGNKDWPQNNFKAWKYYAFEDEEITNQYNDGKWRFLLFDAEFAWGIYGNSVLDNTLKDVLSGNHMGGSSVVLKALFQRTDMREKFANTICDLINGAFSPENVSKVIDKIEKEYKTEISYALNNSYISWWSNIGSFADNRRQMKSYAEKRIYVLYSALNETFKTDISFDTFMYEVTLKNAEGAEAWLNTQRVRKDGDIVFGRYYSSYEVELKAAPYTGYAFDCWEVNGILYYESDLKIDCSMVNESNEINIVLHTKKLFDGLPLYINELYTSGKYDWAELYNPNLIAVSTKEYYLSDDMNNLKKWKMPIVNIQPESSLLITMKDNKSNDALKKPQTNFNLRIGEILYLSDMNGDIIETVSVLDMPESHSYNRLSDGTYKMSFVYSSKIMKDSK